MTGTACSGSSTVSRTSTRKGRSGTVTETCVFGETCPYLHKHPERHQSPPAPRTDEQVFTAAATRVREQYEADRGFPWSSLLPPLAVVMEDAARSSWSPGTPERRNLLVLAREILKEHTP